MRGTEIRVTHWGVTEMRGYLNKGPGDTQNTGVTKFKAIRKGYTKYGNT